MKLRAHDAIAYFRCSTVPLWQKLLGLFAVAYVASPIDLIPDAIPVFGWLDDIGVIALVVTYYVRQMNGWLAAEEAKRLPAAVESGPIAPS